MTNVQSVYEGTASYFNFIESLNSEITKGLYTKCLKSFLEYNGLESPDQIIKIPLDSLEHMLKKFIVYRQKEKQSPAFARLSLYALKHFCRMNKIKLDWDVLQSFQGKVKTKKYSNNDEAYSHQQINQLLSICDIREKAVVLIYASTGIRASALSPLKLKHIEKVQGIYKFIVYESDEEYFTLCTPECAQVLDQYLEYRERFGEKLTPESPLIREEFDTFRRPKPQRTLPRHVTTPAIKYLVVSKLNRLGIREVCRTEGHHHRKKVKLMHGFRKFFETQLLESDVNYVVVKMLMGHDLKLEGSYFRPKLEYIIKEYSKASNNLTINEENRLKRKVEVLTIEKSKVDMALADIAEMKKKIGL